MKNDGVSFEAGGKARTLRFSTNAFCDLEDATGVGIAEIGGQLQGAPRLTFVRACFWAGLRGREPDLLLAEAGDVVDELGLDAAGKLLGEAVQAAFPQPGSETGPGAAEGNGATPAKAGTPKKAAAGTATNS